MRSFVPEEIADILGGNLITQNNGRMVQIFTAQPEDEPLPGSMHFLFDGCEDEKELIKQLKEADAAGVVARVYHGLDAYRWQREGLNIIEVPHMTEPYIELSKVYRSQFDIPFIEVIGSSGKTTTKEMIGAVLNEKMPTLTGFKNYNAPSGVAYNIFLLRDNHKAAVLEVGMKAPGVVEYSSNIIKPSIGVVTSIHRAHISTMGSMDNIIEAKAEILKCLPPEGTLIINGEDKYCSSFPTDRFKGEVLRFGFSDKFDAYAEDIEYKDFKTHFKVRGRDFEVDCVIDTVGRYNVSNALAAVLVGVKMGLEPQQIAEGLSKFKTLNGRLKLYRGINDTILIDDNFNANPDSTKTLIQEIHDFAEGRPIVLVMGDMERPDDDMGRYARETHFMIGEQISKIKFKKLMAIGKWAKEYVNGALSNGISKRKTAYYRDVDEARHDIEKYAVPGSVILFKASVYTDLSGLIEPLKVE